MNKCCRRNWSNHAYKAYEAKLHQHHHQHHHHHHHHHHLRHKTKQIATQLRTPASAQRCFFPRKLTGCVVKMANETKPPKKRNSRAGQNGAAPSRVERERERERKQSQPASPVGFRLRGHLFLLHVRTRALLSYRRRAKTA